MTNGNGVTGNAIEFLVTLGINSKESEKNISKFLEKIEKKDLNLSFNIDKKSSENISEFFKKYENKILKLRFDVNKKDSEANLRTFINNFKTPSPKVVFDASVGKSKDNFNRFLNNVKLNKVKVELDLTNSITKSTVRTALRNVNNNEIFAVLSLDVDKSNSKILKDIKKIKIPDIKIDLGLDNTKQNPKIFEKYEKEIKKLEKTIESLQKKIGSTSSTPSSPTKSSSTKTESTGMFGELIGRKDEVVRQIKEQSKELEKEIEIFRGSVLKGQEDFVNKLKKQGYRVQTEIDPISKEITKVTATIKNSANEIDTKVFKRFTEGYKLTEDSAESSKRAIHGFIQTIEKVDNKSKFNFSDEFEKTETKLDNLRHKGLLTVQQFDRLSKELKKAGNNDDLSKINKEMDKMSNNTKKNLELEITRNRVMQKQQQILANLERTERLYRKTVDKTEAEFLRKEIEGQSLNISSATDMGALQRASLTLDIMQSNVRKLNAQATEATKNSMTMVDAFKIAMERFPIWMMASTAFYGTVRTAREFGAIIIDIDTKITDLKKVMADDTDFSRVFDNATRSAEKFGQTISDTMDAYIEFARQGFEEQELGYLAEASLVASNVADIGAGDMAEFLTASMIQWQMEANQAMSVVDSWNEISNNYATTVEKLAKGQSRAGATARAMGLDFDELNAIIGTVTASTKQSGEEVGWDFSPSPFIW